MLNNNQDPSFYSYNYYTKSCAGHEIFSPGKITESQIFKYIKNLVKDFEGKSVLDIGCGRGELVFNAANMGARRAVGIDFSKDAIKLAKENLQLKPLESVEYIHGDVFEIEFEETFDLIFMTDIIEHLFDEQNIFLFKRVQQWLRPGGQIIVHTMPTTEFIDYGQYLKALFYLLKGKKYQFLSYEKEASVTHVNLQNKAKLSSYLGDFESEIWYDFASKSSLRSLISWIIPRRFIVSNLWAIVKLKSN